jgi:hypothetical protein
MQARHAGVKPLFTPSVLNGLKGRIFTEVRKVSCLKIFAGSTMALTLAIFTTAAWGQIAPQNTGSVVSTSESAAALDQNVAQKISQAWAEGKDASGAVAFQENGEIAMSEGNPQQARHYFDAAEHELSNLKPSSVGSPSTSAY